MRCCKKLFSFKVWMAGLRAFCAAMALMVLSPVVLGQGIDPIAARLLRGAGSEELGKVHAWDLYAEFQVGLPNRLAELARATPIYFVLDWKMSRPRWYWRDEKLSQGQLFWRLSHNPITQQWRLSGPSQSAQNDAKFAISYATLDEALTQLKRIRHENIVQSDALQADGKYELAVRLRLDTTQLPKPFQINAITNRDWTLDSGYLTTSFVAAATVSSFVPVPSATPPISPVLK